MKQSAIGDYHAYDWPSLSYVESFILDATVREKNIARRADGAFFSIDGLYGTEGLPAREGLVSATLYVQMRSGFGAYVQLSRWDGRVQKGIGYVSKGDLSRLDVFVFSKHRTPFSVGLFIPFEQAWLAVKEFMQTEGELPTAIEWCKADDLPKSTFPEMDYDTLKGLKLADPKDAITW